MTRTLLFAELLVDVTREDVVVENDFTTLVALVKIEQFNIETRVLLETNDLVELNAFFELLFPFSYFFTLWLQDTQGILAMKMLFLKGVFMDSQSHSD